MRSAKRRGYVGEHRLRTLKVSQKLMEMLNALPRKSEKVFGDEPINFSATKKRPIHFTTAKTNEKAANLIQVGFEYVCHHEGTMLFRKRK